MRRWTSDMNKVFWQDARNAWINDSVVTVSEIVTNAGGEIDSSLTDDAIPFDAVDYDELVKASFTSMDFNELVDNTKQDTKVPEPEVHKRPKLEADKFETYIIKKTIPDYIEASKLLLKCELPELIENPYYELLERLPVLQDSLTKFNGVYNPDMEDFLDYYIPEALQLTATYLEYLDANISEDILKENENEIIQALDKLNVAVNDKIDEIYKFASIEIKAKAKALEAMMSQNGYVNPDDRI